MKKKNLTRNMIIPQGIILKPTRLPGQLPLCHTWQDSFRRPAMVLLLLVVPLLLSAQSVFIQVRDSNTYRGLPDVQVELKSANTQMTFYTSPEGEVSSNLPPGEYTISFARSGYKVQIRPNVRVRVGEITPVEVFMERDITPGPTTHPDPASVDDPAMADTPAEQHSQPAAPGEMMVAVPAFLNNFFIDLGVNYGAIESAQIGLGYYILPGILPNVYARIGYARSSQAYASGLFADPEKVQQVTFNRLNFGTGAEWDLPVTDKFKLLLMPVLNFGIEYARNKDFIDHEELDSFRGNGLSLGMDVGLPYLIALFYVGADYNFWIGNAMNQERIPLQDGYTGKYINWADELFPERKGFGLRVGVKIRFK